MLDKLSALDEQYQGQMAATAAEPETVDAARPSYMEGRL